MQDVIIKIGQLTKANILNKKKHLLFFKDSVSCEVQDGRLFFISKVNKGYTNENQDVFLNKIKILLKKYPNIFLISYNLFGASFVGKNAKRAIKGYDNKKLILNLGSGIKRISKDVINIDYYPFENVDIVADITDLPFENNSVDFVISEFVIEHMPNPGKLIKEILRVLKPGGKIYITAPFLATFHSSPNDYYRWSKQGLRHFLVDFKEIESGVRCGPTSAMIYVISEWTATILSFGILKIHQILFIILMIVLSPLNLIDYFIYKYPSSENIAYGFYYFGKKK
ncbi:MAG: class I SAM-dependent methyltransferase [Patescibacteria group bacterium]|nr:class I SAM-dependent methyltransferase [Patescibacteria group bacterium]